MNSLSVEHDNVIFHEMMAHPALFSHPSPKRIAIVGDEEGEILNEILKHQAVAEIWRMASKPISITDQRVHYCASSAAWMNQVEDKTFDIVINAGPAEIAILSAFFNMLSPKGMLVQQSASPFALEELKTAAKQIKTVGFSDVQCLSFPQPSFSSGWRSALLTIKEGNLKRVREKDIYNKTFSTIYYNFDMHKASLALPEFFRQDWIHA